MVPAKISRGSLIAALGLAALAAGLTARADGAPKARASDDVPCAVVEKFGGDLQVLGPDRALAGDLHHGTPVACGGWVSTASGWVTLEHRNGASLTIGPKSFVGLRDDKAPGRGTAVQGGAGDHVVLYRGEVHGVAGRGHGPLNVITPNARARLERASAIVIYSAGDEESQLITLEDEASLENRFEPSRKMTVKQGEASSLNFKLLRVVPSAPRAIAQASLKPHLVALRIPPRERAKALANAYTRAERRIAATFPATTKNNQQERAPASESAAGSYERNPPDPNDAKLKQHMIDRIVGGEHGDESILFPERYTGKRAQGKIQVEDMDSKLEAPNRPPSPKEEEAEKRRLIDALSKVNDD